MAALKAAKKVIHSSAIFHPGILCWQHLQGFSEADGDGETCDARGARGWLLVFSSLGFALGDMLSMDCCGGVFNCEKTNPTKAPETKEARVRRRLSCSGEC